MTGEDLIAALNLPEEVFLRHRVPKKMLAEKGHFAAADKRRIQEGVESLEWVAVLKPTTIGVQTFVDADREYLEIAVLNLTLRPEGKASRLTELVHRAVPYPVVLILEEPTHAVLSLIHKRRSLGEAEKFVLDGDAVATPNQMVLNDTIRRTFLAALSLKRQPLSSLFTLYQGWMDTITELRVAEITGEFRPVMTAARSAERRELLRTCEAMADRMAGLRRAAEKETRIPRLVEINLELARLRTAYAAAKAKL